ncbi:MAG: nuclear transport factor 2 family protein [Actinomycetota bacterium]|nr:nuclear transport factor 2 family protein [Actinomycetota bacterium]
MSRESMEVVRRLFSAVSCGDGTAMLRELDPDVVLDVEGNAGQDLYRGHEGVTKSYVDWTEDFDEFQVVAEEFLDRGDCVVVRTRQTGSGRSSGIPMEGLFWFVCQVREGKVVRMHVLGSEQKALEAAGLRE